MSLLFTPAKIGSLELPNRIIRSATAELMANDLDGSPREQLKSLWVALAKGGTGLIISGHMYVHPSGKCHPEMTGIYSDELISSLKECVDAVHVADGNIAVQINHGGMQCDKRSVDETIAPSALDEDFLEQPAREMSTDEIEMLIDAYGQAARRAKEAGFDAVQIHSAHGYLISQFNSPYTNRRTDKWGGDLQGRTRFLREVTRSVREQVGNEYPVFVKFGMEDGLEGGLTAEAGAVATASMIEMGLDAIEISGGVQANSSRKGIRDASREAYFRPLVQLARKKTDLPLIMVGGMRSKTVMEEVLSSGDADFVAMCRPLINEPNFPNLMKTGVQEISGCISSSNCWAETLGEGIACKCPPLRNT
jgi:2,4-dienoyl-CoA reductase-like NADH-dependent reductase (Old Yellow Enzyme family)